MLIWASPRARQDHDALPIGRQRFDLGRPATWLSICATSTRDSTSLNRLISMGVGSRPPAPQDRRAQYPGVRRRSSAADGRRIRRPAARQQPRLRPSLDPCRAPTTINLFLMRGTQTVSTADKSGTSSASTAAVGRSPAVVVVVDYLQKCRRPSPTPDRVGEGDASSQRPSRPRLSEEFPMIAIVAARQRWPQGGPPAHHHLRGSSVHN